MAFGISMELNTFTARVAVDIDYGQTELPLEDVRNRQDPLPLCPFMVQAEMSQLLAVNHILAQDDPLGAREESMQGTELSMQAKQQAVIEVCQNCDVNPCSPKSIGDNEKDEGCRALRDLVRRVQVCLCLGMNRAALNYLIESSRGSNYVGSELCLVKAYVSMRAEENGCRQGNVEDFKHLGFTVLRSSRLSKAYLRRQEQLSERLPVKDFAMEYIVQSLTLDPQLLPHSCGWIHHLKTGEPIMKDVSMLSQNGWSNNKIKVIQIDEEDRKCQKIVNEYKNLSEEHTNKHKYWFHGTTTACADNILSRK